MNEHENFGRRILFFWPYFLCSRLIQICKKMRCPKVFVTHSLMAVVEQMDRARASTVAYFKIRRQKTNASESITVLAQITWFLIRLDIATNNSRKAFGKQILQML